MSGSPTSGEQQLLPLLLSYTLSLPQFVSHGVAQTPLFHSLCFLLLFFCLLFSEPSPPTYFSVSSLSSQGQWLLESRLILNIPLLSSPYIYINIMEPTWLRGVFRKACVSTTSFWNIHAWGYMEGIQILYTCYDQVDLSLKYHFAFF